MNPWKSQYQYFTLFYLQYNSQKHMIIKKVAILKKVNAVGNSINNSKRYWQFQLNYFLTLTLLSNLLYIILHLTLYYIIYSTMGKELIKVAKKGGKQGKKKWMKNINTDELMNSLEDSHNQQLRSTFKKPVIIQDIHKKSHPLDPNRFKRKQIDPKLLSKTQTKIVKKINLQDIAAHNKRIEAANDDFIEDVWDKPIQPKLRENQPVKRVQEQDIIRTPAVMKPLGGESYNPSAQQFQKLVDKIVQIEGEKEKRVIVPKIKKIQKKLTRTRNRAVRKEQLDAIQRKKQRMRQHHQNNLGLVNKMVEKEIQKGKNTRKVNQQKQKQLLEQRKTGWISQGPALLKSRKYQYKADIIPDIEATELSKMPFRESIIRDRMDSIYRRSIIQPKNFTANPKIKKSIKVRPPLVNPTPYW